MRLSIKLPLAALVLLVPALAVPDIVVLQDGTRLEGRVEPVVGSEDRIAFISSSGRIELPRARIAEIIEEDDATDWTRIGRQHMRARNYTSALRMFQQAVEADPEHEDALAGLEEARRVIEEQQEERTRQMQQQLTQELERVPDLIAEEKFGEAEGILDRILAAPATDEQQHQAQRLMRELYLAWGFARYDRLDYRTAEEKYLRVLEMDPDNREARARLLRIWRNDPEKKPEVLEAYLEKLEEDPANLEYNRVAGELLYEAERYEEAIEPLRRVHGVPRLANQGYDRMLRTSYRELIGRLGEQKKWEEAIERYQELLQLFPREDTTPLVVLQYERDKEQLGEEDWDGRALLAKELREQGLTRFANREIELILRYDPENEIAESLLREEAEEELARAERAFRRGEFLIARDIAQRFSEEHTRFDELVEEAEELFQRADIEARRQAQETRERAREIAERGIQYYTEAVRHVDRMYDQQRRTTAFAISDRQQAITLARRSVDHYQTALRLDPSLGPMTGMDLNARLRDAQQLVNALTDRPAPIPGRRTIRHSPLR